MLASKSDRIYITPPPGVQFNGDVVVTENGLPLAVSEADAYTLDLPKSTVYVEVTSKDDHVLTVTHRGTSARFATETELALGWFFLDLFTTGPIGIAVDWATHAWRRPTPLIIRMQSPAPGVAKR